ncbi:MAG TPA: DUF2269 domain-containing protein [Pseudomonadales bacterium]|nr:DUF2269 domain-containing protein [Pseudomonadales bacterium]
MLVDNYLLLKYIHIICAFVLSGTGAGIAFFMLMASRTKNISAISVTARHVILADWIFTTPAVIGQFITGVLLMRYLHYSFTSIWFLSVASLFLFIGCCWIPVVFIQYKLKKMAEASEITGELNEGFYFAMKWWVTLGVPAFIGILVMLWLMVFKPFPVI